MMSQHTRALLHSLQKRLTVSIGRFHALALSLTGWHLVLLLADGILSKGGKTPSAGGH